MNEFRLTVPWIGAQIILVEPWTFRLYNEARRNGEMWIVCGGPESPHSSWSREREKEIIDVTLPVNTILAVDRIYIRKGAVDYDSLTFFLKACDDPRFNVPRIGKTGKPLKPKFVGQRFWAKLKDVNRIVCKPILPEGSDAATEEAFKNFSGYKEEF